MKIVILSRWIYPSNMPRATRANELAIELARQGHDVILYGELGEYDYSSFEQKHHVKLKHIKNLIFSTFGFDGIPIFSMSAGILRKLFGRIIEFPDIQLMFKIPKIIELEKGVDILISIAMPYPIHWGCALAKSINKKGFPKIWVADCGDPYMGNKCATKMPPFYFKYIEKWFCREADYLSVPLTGAIEGYYAEFRDKIVVIPQGGRLPVNEFDTFNPINDIPTFAYAGIFYKGSRDPTAFLEYLMAIKLKFKCIFFTGHEKLLIPYLNKLGSKLEIREFIPRERLLKVLAGMDFLINFENSTSVQSPSKLIDYAIVNRPILSIPNHFLPVDTITEFLNGDYRNRYIINNINQYRIENVAKKFLSLYEQKFDN